jgi:hypothetical protein
MTTHAKAVRDYQYLDSVQEVDDIVTAMDEVEFLMMDPTKKRATDMLEGLISIWFSEASLDGRSMDAKTKRIARYYGHQDYIN